MSYSLYLLLSEMMSPIHYQSPSPVYCRLHESGLLQDSTAFAQLVLSKPQNEQNGLGASHDQSLMTSWFLISFYTGESPQLGIKPLTFNSSQK